VSKGKGVEPKKDVLDVTQGRLAATLATLRVTIVKTLNREKRWEYLVRKGQSSMIISKA